MIDDRDEEFEMFMESQTGRQVPGNDGRLYSLAETHGVAVADVVPVLAAVVTRHWSCVPVTEADLATADRWLAPVGKDDAWLTFAGEYRIMATAVAAGKLAVSVYRLSSAGLDGRRSMWERDLATAQARADAAEADARRLRLWLAPGTEHGPGSSAGAVETAQQRLAAALVDYLGKVLSQSSAHGLAARDD